MILVMDDKEIKLRRSGGDKEKDIEVRSMN